MWRRSLITGVGSSTERLGDGHEGSSTRQDSGLVHALHGAALQPGIRPFGLAAATPERLLFLRQHRSARALSPGPERGGWQSSTLHWHAVREALLESLTHGPATTFGGFVTVPERILMLHTTYLCESARLPRSVAVHAITHEAFANLKQASQSCTQILT